MLRWCTAALAMLALSKKPVALYGVTSGQFLECT
jgi:hypothetical protein